MAIFIFCSGACFRDGSLMDSPWKYIKKKLRTLYVPYVAFNSVVILLNNVFVKLNIYTDDETFINADIGIANFFGLKHKITFLEMLRQIGGTILFGKNGETQLGGAMWFLRVLFIITLFFFMIQYVSQKVLSERFDYVGMWVQLIVSLLLLLMGWNGHAKGAPNTYQYLTCASIYFTYVMGWLFTKAKCIDLFKICM